MTTVGDRQGYLLFPTLFNIFLERIMTDALEYHMGTVTIGERTLTNLCFTDDSKGLARDEQELVKLVERLDTTSAAYRMEINAKKKKSWWAILTQTSESVAKSLRLSTALNTLDQLSKMKDSSSSSFFLQVDR